MINSGGILPAALDIDLRLRAAAQAAPAKPALSDSQRSVTWGELDKRINRIARALIARGVGPGERVAVLGANSVSYVEMMLATVRAGACTVPLSTYVTAKTRAAMVKDSGSRLLFLSALYEAEARPLAAEMGLAESDLLPLDDASVAKFMANEPDSPPDVEISPELGFNLIYSSGTTGTPKG